MTPFKVLQYFFILKKHENPVFNSTRSFAYSQKKATTV